MASKISAIKTQLITDIKTTSIVGAFEGPTVSETAYPWAEVAYGGGDVEISITQVVDREYRMIVRVHGLDVEQVELAIEELTVLWHNQTLLAVLRALGVLTIYPVSHYPPFVFSGGTQLPVMGDIEFVFSVRFTV